MDILLLLARLVLSGVLLVAAYGKFADLEGSREAMRGFGIPRNLVPVAGLGLPIVELLLGLGLLPVSTAWWAALSAMLLMLVFIGGIAWNLRQGRTPDCHCFGQLHSEPAGPRTILRNGLLALIALFIVMAGWGDPGVSLGGWIADRTGFEMVVLVGGIVMAGAIVLLGWLVTQLMAQNGRILDRLDALETAAGIATAPAPAAGEKVAGLPIGARAPEFTLPDLSGEPTSLTALRAPGRTLLLFFTNPGCEPCQRILAQIPNWQERAGKQIDLVVISRGSVVANEEKARQHGLSRVLIQDGREVNKSFGVESTPSAVVVRSDGTIGSAVAAGANAVTALVEETLPRSGQATANPEGVVGIGDSVPALPLATLDGTTFAGIPTGREAFLLFWSPTCGYCRRLAPDLLAWEASRPADAPHLVIVSNGQEEAIREEGFASTVLIDGGANIRARFGSRGTPSALRIDAAGRVVTPVAHGADQVMSLLRHGAATSAVSRSGLENGQNPPSGVA